MPKLAPCVHENNAKFLKSITKEEQTALTSIIQTMLKNVDAADYLSTEQEHEKGGTK